jgi:mersacidin/lichenicidin family type 2 lantibiotic
MSPLNIIRAWKDEEYRLSLSDAERAQLPENPAGLIELADAELDPVAGGIITPFCSGDLTNCFCTPVSRATATVCCR